jgi:hypothetical protein
VDLPMRLAPSISNAFFPLLDDFHYLKKRNLKNVETRKKRSLNIAKTRKKRYENRRRCRFPGTAFCLDDCFMFIQI